MDLPDADFRVSVTGRQAGRGFAIMRKLLAYLSKQGGQISSREV